LVFFGGYDSLIRSYLYGDDGDLGSAVSGANHFDAIHGQAIDIVNQVIISVQDDWGAGYVVYNDSGTLSGKGEIGSYSYYPHNVALESVNRVAFVTTTINNKMVSYKYTTSGVMTKKEDITIAGGGGRACADGTRRIGFVQSGTVIYPFTYDADGTNLAFGTSYDTGGTVRDMEIDTDNLVLFVSNSGNKGMAMYRYNETTGSLALLDSWTDSTNNFSFISVDFINKVVLLSSTADLDFLTYE